MQCGSSCSGGWRATAAYCCIVKGRTAGGPLIIVCKPSKAIESMLLAARVAAATLAHRSAMLASDAAIPGTCYVSNPTGVCAVSAVLQLAFRE
jgi:hypothetical protein